MIIPLIIFSVVFLLFVGWSLWASGWIDKE